MAPDVTIVVVSYNTRDLLRACLASIFDNPFHQFSDQGSPDSPAASSSDRVAVEVIVVDNGSADASAETVETEFPRARLIVSETNLGFAKATNLGLSHARGELLLLLNPDTEIVGDAIVQLVAFLRSRERAAAAGPSLRYADGTPQQAAFTFPTLWMSFLDFFPLHHRLLNSGLNGRYRAPTDGTPFRIGHPLGAAMLIKRSAIERIGPLDEQFFIYCEEVDWCIRAQRAGLDVYQVPSAVVVHHGGQSTGQFREAMLVELHRSRYQLFRKHYSPRFIAAHRLITRCGLLKVGAHARWQKATGKMSSEQLRSRLRAYSAIWGM